MIKFEHTEIFGWEAAIRGMRNPMNSWEMSDTVMEHGINGDYAKIGPNDLDLMKRLHKAGTDHGKFMRMITVYTDITAPLYWWKEFDTYKVGTVANSCSTMHKIHAKEFTFEDFSCEHLTNGSKLTLSETIDQLNECRTWYLKWDAMQEKDKKSFDPIITCKKDLWWQMIQLLPSSYNQKRTVMLNYEVLANIYKSRRNHKLDEWAETKLVGDCPKNMYPSKFINGFCDWIKTLPYSELITGNFKEED